MTNKETRSINVLIALLWSLPFYAAGWLVGLLVKSYKLARAAVVLGFSDGAALRPIKQSTASAKESNNV